MDKQIVQSLLKEEANRRRNQGYKVVAVVYLNDGRVFSRGYTYERAAFSWANLHFYPGFAQVGLINSSGDDIWRFGLRDKWTCI